MKGRDLSSPLDHLLMSTAVPALVCSMPPGFRQPQHAAVEVLRCIDKHEDYEANCSPRLLLPEVSMIQTPQKEPPPRVATPATTERAVALPRLITPTASSSDVGCSTPRTENGSVSGRVFDPLLEENPDRFCMYPIE